MPPPDKTGPTGPTGATGATGPAGATGAAGSSGAAGVCYFIYGWRPGAIPEFYGAFASLAGAQAKIPDIAHNDNVVIVGPLPVAQIVQGSLIP